MKTLLLFALLAAGLLLPGCAEDPEDKAFFEQGWLHPGKMDARLRSQQ